MAITASMIKELRQRTGAGMMDCKKVLTETDGDIDAAIEELRKRGAAAAEKKAGRIAAEGVIASASSASAGRATMPIVRERCWHPVVRRGIAALRGF